MVKEDEHGQYREDAGSPHPIEPEDVSYQPCNAVLRHTWDRYGERRYCSGMAVGTFEEDGVDTNYENPEFCRHHQSRAELMKQRAENFKTGAHAKSHEHVFQMLELHEQILANDLYKSLLEESNYEGEWETEDVELEVDADETEFAPDADTIVLEHPVPTNHQIRGKALWHAALDFVTMESIRQEQFRVAAEESFEGRDLSIGERVEVVSVTDDGNVIEDTAEHHLNLPLSRLQKDYERHMEFGGVEYEGGSEDSADMTTRDWVVELSPNEPEVQPEAQTGDTSPMAELDVPEPDDE